MLHRPQLFSCLTKLPTNIFTCLCGSVTAGGILDRAIEAESNQHRDILRLVGASSLSKSFSSPFLLVHSYGGINKKSAS